MKKINLSFLIILLILVVFSYFYVSLYSKYDVMLYLDDYKEIIQLNHLIEVLLFITISFFIYKIFFSHNNAFGSVITKKIFLLLISVVIIPSLINIKIANYFIDSTVNRLFNPQIEELFDNSFNIAEESIKYFSNELRKKSSATAEYIKLMDKKNSSLKEKNKALKNFENVLDINGLMIYKSNGSINQKYNTFDNNQYFSISVPKNILEKLKTNGYFYEINKDRLGNYLFYYYQLDGNNIIVLNQIAPDFISVDNAKIMQNKNLYLGLLNNRDKLKDVYTSTLIISVLLSITIAVLLSIFFAKFLIKRISNLIENIELIKKGSFLNSNKFEGDDELSQLINAFNEMSHKLSEVRKLEQFQKEQITAYKNYLENLVNNLSLSVIVYNQELEITSLNTITSKILDINLNKVKSLNLGAWVAEYHYLKDLVNLIKINLQNNKKNWEENLILKTETSVKNIFVKTVQFKNNENEQYITLTSDVTNLIKAKQNKAWADIAKRLAHEIKNPLTPIVLSAERIEMKLSSKLNSEDQVFLSRLVKQIIIQVEDLKNLVNKFRDFANISKPLLSKIIITEFFNQFLILYENIKFIKLNITKECKDAIIMGDMALLRQVFHNLIKNAMESVENIDDKLIEISVNLEEEYVIISIKDNGHGFNNEILENLYEPYRTTKGVKGSGLGMAVVKKIIDEHDGKIDVYNDNGAMVKIKLPLSN